MTQPAISVQPAWCSTLTLQQQSVILLAARGPDGKGKKHPCKAVQRAYRGTVFLAGKFGRLLEYGEKADSFMSLDRFGNDALWVEDVKEFFNSSDGLSASN